MEHLGRPRRPETREATKAQRDSKSVRVMDGDRETQESQQICQRDWRMATVYWKPLRVTSPGANKELYCKCTPTPLALLWELGIINSETMGRGRQMSVIIRNWSVWEGDKSKKLFLYQITRRTHSQILLKITKLLKALIRNDPLDYLPGNQCYLLI